MMDRRHFIKTSALSGILLGLGLPSLPAAATTTPRRMGRVRLRVGILSDTHVKDEPSRDRFLKALRYFRDRKVDAVIIAGDLSDNGLVPEYKRMASAWFEVFPDDKGSDGEKVERIFVYGNHEIESWRYGYVKKLYDEPTRKALAIEPVKEQLWEECWHEPFSPIYIKDVKGYKFIGAHYVNRKTIPGLEAFFQQVDTQLPKGKKPFFYVQHMHPKGTCSSPWVWGQDDGTVTTILSRYPNAIAFSGHSHTPLTDERTIWQGAFTSIGTASLSYMIPIGGRENSKPFGSKEKEPSQMAPIKGREGHHGQMMTLFDDYIVIDRHEFEYDEDLGRWIFPLGQEQKPYAFEERAAEENAPQFSEGAAVTVSPSFEGADRYGVPTRQVEVSFPAAVAHDGHPRPLDYEVQVEVEGVDVFKAVLTKRVYSGRFFLGEKKDAEAPVRCLFAENELPPQGRYRFSVRPCSGFGKKGESICSSVVSVLHAPDALSI